MGGRQLSPTVLNLALPEANRLKAAIDDIMRAYKAEFPPDPTTANATVTESVLLGQNSVSAEVSTVVETCADEDDYKACLASYQEGVKKHETNAIKDYIMARVALVVSSYDPDTTSAVRKLKKVLLLQEPTRKGFFASEGNMAHIEPGRLAQMHQSALSATRSHVTADDLQPLCDIYMEFRVVERGDQEVQEPVPHPPTNPSWLQAPHWSLAY